MFISQIVSSLLNLLYFSLFPPKTVCENIMFYMMLQQNVIIFKIFNITLQIIMVKFSNK